MYEQASQALDEGIDLIHLMHVQTAPGRGLRGVGSVDWGSVFALLGASVFSCGPASDLNDPDRSAKGRGNFPELGKR